MRKRLVPADRKTEILEAALKVAARPGSYASLTRAAVATEANCSEGLVSSYFSTMTAFKRAIMRAAIHRGELSIIAQGVACGDGVACKAAEELKQRALSSLAG